MDTKLKIKCPKCNSENCNLFQDKTFVCFDCKYREGTPKDYWEPHLNTGSNHWKLSGNINNKRFFEGVKNEKSQTVFY